jgi:hypothetical protein
MQSRTVHDRPVKFAIAALSLAMTWFFKFLVRKKSIPIAIGTKIRLPKSFYFTRL